jgi:hypothetical protein
MFDLANRIWSPILNLRVPRSDKKPNVGRIQIRIFVRLLNLQIFIARII